MKESASPLPDPCTGTCGSALVMGAGVATVGSTGGSATVSFPRVTGAWLMAWVAASDPEKSSIPGTASVAVSGLPARMASAATASESASAGRSAGSLASIDITSERTGTGMFSGNGGGVSLTWARAIAIWDSPVNGRRPANSS